MAYNNRNKLQIIIEIQTIVLQEKKRGVSQKHVYETIIAQRYRIARSTFNNYMCRNARAELTEQLITN